MFFNAIVSYLGIVFNMKRWDINLINQYADW